MADSIQDFDLTVGSQFAFAALLKKITPLMAFTTNVVDEDGSLRTVNSSQVRKGKTIDVRLYEDPGDDTTPGSGDFNKVTNNYETVDDLDIKTVQVNLNIHKKASFSMDDAQLELFVDGLPQILLTNYAYKLGRMVAKDVQSIITPANFPNETVIAASAMDFDQVAANRKVAVDEGWDTDNLWQINDTAYYLSLLQDDTTQTLISRQTDQLLRNAEIGKLHTINLIESTEVPDNGDDLHGYLTDKTAIAIAGAILMPGRGTATAALVIEHVVATDPITGMSMGMRQHYDAATGEVFVTMEMVYGRSPGRAALQRLVTV